jgi:hypothetical protein
VTPSHCSAGAQAQAGHGVGPQAVAECSRPARRTAPAGLPDVIRARLASAACAAKLMTPEVAMLFARDAPGEVVLPTCVQLDPPALTELVTECATPRWDGWRTRGTRAPGTRSMERPSSPSFPLRCCLYRGRPVCTCCALCSSLLCLQAGGA